MFARKLKASLTYTRPPPSGSSGHHFIIHSVPLTPNTLYPTRPDLQNFKTLILHLVSEILFTNLLIVVMMLLFKFVRCILRQNGTYRGIVVGTWNLHWIFFPSFSYTPLTYRPVILITCLFIALSFVAGQCQINVKQ